MADELKQLLQSSCDYWTRPKCLFTSITELMKCSRTTDPEEEETDKLVKLLFQLEERRPFSNTWTHELQASSMKINCDLDCENRACGHIKFGYFFQAFIAYNFFCR